jgi:hypothetical protein
MDKCENVSGEEDILSANIPDDALERAAGSFNTAAFTFNYCTYNYYQCGPIGSRT